MRKPIQYPLLAYDARDEMPYVYENDRFLVTHGSYQNTLWNIYIFLKGEELNEG